MRLREAFLCIYRQPNMNRRQLMVLMDCSASAATRMFQRLRERGLIEKSAGQRYAAWSVVPGAVAPVSVRGRRGAGFKKVPRMPASIKPDQHPLSQAWRK